MLGARRGRARLADRRERDNGPLGRARRHSHRRLEWLAPDVEKVSTHQLLQSGTTGARAQRLARRARRQCALLLRGRRKERIVDLGLQEATARGGTAAQLVGAFGLLEQLEEGLELLTRDGVRAVRVHDLEQLIEGVDLLLQVDARDRVLRRAAQREEREEQLTHPLVLTKRPNHLEAGEIAVVVRIHQRERRTCQQHLLRLLPCIELGEALDVLALGRLLLGLLSLLHGSDPVEVALASVGRRRLLSRRDGGSARLASQATARRTGC